MKANCYAKDASKVAGTVGRIGGQQFAGLQIAKSPALISANEADIANRHSNSTGHWINPFPANPNLSVAGSATTLIPEG
ncbi:MAG: hypothetical protein QM800_06805 [Paludibacter sp.]